MKVINISFKGIFIFLLVLFKQNTNDLYLQDINHIISLILAIKEIIGIKIIKINFILILYIRMFFMA